jgi:hypothetical protein
MRTIDLQSWALTYGEILSALTASPWVDKLGVPPVAIELLDAESNTYNAQPCVSITDRLGYKTLLYLNEDDRLCLIFDCHNCAATVDVTEAHTRLLCEDCEDLERREQEAEMRAREAAYNQRLRGGGNEH